MLRTLWSCSLKDSQESARRRNSATGAAITNNETLEKSTRIFSVFPRDNTSFPETTPITELNLVMV